MNDATSASDDGESLPPDRAQRIRERIERERASRHRYYLEHRDEIKAKAAAYQRAHPEMARASNARAYRKRRDGQRTSDEQRQQQAVALRTARSHRDRQRDLRLRQNHGVTLEDYQATFAAQGQRCALCGATENGQRAFHLDHDHETDESRGILCAYCNHRLVVVEDPEWLERARDYLLNPPMRALRSTGVIAAQLPKAEPLENRAAAGRKGAMRRWHPET